MTDKLRDAYAEALIAEKIEDWRWFTAGAGCNVLVHPTRIKEHEEASAIYKVGKQGNRTNWLDVDEEGHENCYFYDSRYGERYPRFPQYLTSMEEAGRLLSVMQTSIDAFSFSFSIWGVPSISSLFPGYQVAFKRGVCPPERKADPRTIMVEAQSLPRAVGFAALRAIGEDISPWDGFLLYEGEEV